MRSLVLLLSILTLSGCSLLIGNVRPVEEKSDEYGVMDLSKKSSDWIRLDSTAEAPKEAMATEASDVAFQSRQTSSIISLNSACRSSTEAQAKDLRSLTNLLFLGISDIYLKSQSQLTVQNTPALETTVQGRLGGEEMILRTVVLRRENCIYDLVYMARPRNFELHLDDFSHFVASLRLK